MKRLLVLPLFALLACLPCRAAAPELQPLPAAEAEQRTAESRDALADILWLKTDDYWHAGEWNEAIRLCRQLVQLDPQFVEAWTGAAWMLWSSERDAEAIELFQNGITANPTNWELPHEFGMYYHTRKQWEEALTQFRRAAELNAPAPIQRMLPKTLEDAGRKEEALTAWRELLQRFPNDPIAKKHVEQLTKEDIEKRPA
jgi:tetratricopeptide (TPR) repeat protein